MKTNQALTARFWALVNGSPVKLTVREGEELHWGRGWRHEEGWSSESAIYRIERDCREGRLPYVVCEWGTDGTDCDGRLSAGGTSVANVMDLKSGYIESEEVRYPKWESEEGWQRDYQAEAAGY